MYPILMITLPQWCSFKSFSGRSPHSCEDDSHHHDRVRVQGHRLQHVRRRGTKVRAEKGEVTRTSIYGEQCDHQNIAKCL